MLGYFGIYSAPEAKAFANAVEENPRLGLLPHQIGEMNARPNGGLLSLFKFLQIRPAA